MKGLSTKQNVHKSMNIVHDLATLIFFASIFGTIGSTYFIKIA